MTAKVITQLGALSACLAVGLGAFGAHALKARLSAELLVIFETGVRYQMYHSLALLAVGILGLLLPTARLGLCAGLFLAGIVIFSGSLYTLALSGVRTWGAVTPLGGLCLLAGWLLLAWKLGKIDLP